MSGPGIVYIVGAGPGDPGLITVRGLACLRRAEVVAYDRLVAPALLAEAPAAAEQIAVGKRPGCHGPRQEEINELLIRWARAGRVVVRLKGGDPFVFGRGGEEALACAEAGVEWEVVPGVSSAIAAPALAGIPVTHRGLARTLTIVTGHCAGTTAALGTEFGASSFQSDPDWRALGQSDTLVVLMGLAALPRIAAALIAAGRPASTPAALVAAGSLSAQQVIAATLGTIASRAAAEGIVPPATLVVGEVVRLAERLAAMAEALPAAALAR